MEVEYWTEDPDLMQGAQRFLVKLMRDSKDLDPDANSHDPELAPIEFDDDAMAEAVGELDDWEDLDG